MPAVMNRERAKPVGAENFAGGAEAFAERVTGKRCGFTPRGDASL
jgi:hypothetical protein